MGCDNDRPQRMRLSSSADIITEQSTPSIRFRMLKSWTILGCRCAPEIRRANRELGLTRLPASLANMGCHVRRDREMADLAHLASLVARRNPDSKSSRCSSFGRKPSDAVVLEQNGSAFRPAERGAGSLGGGGSEHLL